MVQDYDNTNSKSSQKVSSETSALNDKTAPASSAPLNPVITLLIEKRLAVLDEYQREKGNPTLYSDTRLNEDWTKMTEVRLVKSSTSLSHDAHHNVMVVPDAVYDQVRANQMAIQYLEQAFYQDQKGAGRRRQAIFWPTVWRWWCR